MTSLKLKFKIETLFKIIKYTGVDDDRSSKSGDSKTKNKPSSAKQSARSSKIINMDYETLPGYELEIGKLDSEDKEEVLDLMKSIEFSTLLNIFTILQNKQFYFKIKSKIGLDIIRSMYKDLLKMKNENNSVFLGSEVTLIQDSLLINDDCELYYSLREVINLSELDAMDLFDLFSYNEYFAITEQIFISLIYLLSACECGHLEDFFNIFYEDILVFISGGEKFISVSRMKEVGRVIGFTEKTLTKAANDMNLNMNSYIDSGKFKNFYSILSKIHDEQSKYKITFVNVVSNNPSSNKDSTPVKGAKSSQQEKTKSGCMSKACNIL